MFRFVSLCAILAVLSPVAQSAPIDVYVIAGQSNAWGQGKWNDVPNDQRGIAPGSLYYRPFRDGGFGEVRPIAGQFGLEVGFSQAYYERSGRMPAIVKHAVGSTTLAVDWDPASGPLYREMIDAVDLAMETWTLQGHQPRLAGFVWMQGEHDAKSAAFAAAYADNLRGFVDSVRQDLNRRSLPFVLGRIAVPNHPYRDLVRDAQASVRGVKMIDTDGVHLKSDLVHYDTQGQLALGRMFAEQFYVRSPEKRLKLELIGQHLNAVPEPSSLLLSGVLSLALCSMFRCSFRRTSLASRRRSA